MVYEGLIYVGTIVGAAALADYLGIESVLTWFQRPIRDKDHLQELYDKKVKFFPITKYFIGRKLSRLEDSGRL